MTEQMLGSEREDGDMMRKSGVIGIGAPRASKVGYHFLFLKVDVAYIGVYFVIIMKLFICSLYIMVNFMIVKF